MAKALSQKGSAASSLDRFIPVVQEVVPVSFVTASLRMLKALVKDLVALEKSPDTRRPTPWLFRLQAYLIEFMVDDMTREIV
jgi:hypothetical protein